MLLIEEKKLVAWIQGHMYTNKSQTSRIKRPAWYQDVPFNILAPLSDQECVHSHLSDGKQVLYYANRVLFYEQTSYTLHLLHGWMIASN